ncbi:MAG: hypothetical protein ABIZ81_07670 [Opitutaceae bacterium]
MNARGIYLLGIVWGFGAGLCHAAEPEAVPLTVSGPTIALPPMVVNDTAGSTVWLYASVQGDEYLSSCSARTTQKYIESDQRLLRELGALVPEEFLAKLPSITLLADPTVAPKANDAVAAEVLGSGKSQPLVGARPGRVHYLASLSLDGRDVSALFLYLDKDELDQRKLLLTADDLRFRLERRTPMLPPWLVEGILALYARRDTGETAYVFPPIRWLSAQESAAIARDPARPRSLLPAAEMFAPDALRGEGNRHPLRVRTLQCQVELFVRWALDPRNGMRDAFWNFARRAGEERVTGEMFQQCFGFGFSDLRDRLNDYLPIALQEPLRLPARKAAPFSIPEVRKAERPEILRLRGEWERLEIGYVQRTQPAFAPRYIEQARRTIANAYQEGGRDPRLLAAIGLCEVDAGHAADGQRSLEQAIAAGANTPRAYHEVARFRFGQLLRDQPSNRLFTANEIAAIVEPLRKATAFTPELPEVFGLLADAWTRCRETPPAGDVEALVHGAKSFALNPTVSYRLALALARAGRRAEARELLTTGIEYVADDANRARFAQLHAALSTGASASGP